MTNITKKVRQTKREIGEVTIKNTVSYLAALGWKISYYGASADNKFLNDLGLVEYAREREAFKYSSKDVRIVFIRENLTQERKLACLLHELGHIVLLHSLNPTPKEEEEANLFAVLCTSSSAITKPAVSPKLIIAACSALLIVAVLVTSQFWKTPAEALPAQLPSPPLQNILSETEPETEETVFISSGGDKYHLEDCRYVSGKPNVVEITLEEAANLGKEPCSVCKP